MKPKKGLLEEKQIITSIDADLDGASDEKELAEEQSNSKPDKLPPNVVKSKNRWWLKYVITTAVLGVMTLLIALGLGVFSITNQKFLLGELSTAFFVPGIFAVGFGLLILCSNGGAFDIFAYGFMSIIRMFKKDPLDRKYGGYGEYRKLQREKKRSFWYLVIVGGVFVLIGGVLLIAFNLV
ncbi:MAG: DUF3899 domain-containing protein [Clostridiales bacterium]|nr:DUF3899 domain-containing protein [Clostridiales bacterium]